LKISGGLGQGRADGELLYPFLVFPLRKIVEPIGGASATILAGAVGLALAPPWLPEEIVAAAVS